jgi:ABC-type transporter MlaC component
LPARFLGLFLAGSAFAQVDPAIDQFVQVIQSSLLAISAQAPARDGGAREGCGDLMARVLDVGAMAQAASDDAWDLMTQPQRERFREGFARRLRSDCIGPIRDYRGEPVTLAGVRPLGPGERLVAIRLGAEDAPGRVITWRLRAGGPDGEKAVDIIVDGRSTVASLRNEISAVLQAQKGDIDALIGYLNK